MLEIEDQEFRTNVIKMPVANEKSRQHEITDSASRETDILRGSTREVRDRSPEQNVNGVGELCSRLNMMVGGICELKDLPVEISQSESDTESTTGTEDRFLKPSPFYSLQA